MRITDAIRGKTGFSLEIFPPKAGAALDTIYNTIDALTYLKPDFISVTYGASGSTSKATLEVAERIANVNNLLPLPHYTVLEADHSTVDSLISRMQVNNIYNILALRGDLPAGFEHNGPFKYATDFIKYLRRSAAHLCIGAAAYPEGHFETKNLEQETQYLQLKAENGADFFITQLFFDNAHYFRLLEAAAKRGIAQPILAGIMPVLSAKYLTRIISLSGVEVPAALSKLVARYGDDNVSMEQAGVEYAQQQISDLFKHKIAGIHLYCMNRPDIAGQIYINFNKLHSV